MIRTKRNLAVIMILIFIVSLFTACGSQNTGSQEANTSEEKPAYKELTVYTSLPESEVPVYMNAFQEKTGIKINYVRLSAGEVLTKLQVEKNNPQASVWHGGPADTFIAAAQDGLLAKYDSPELRNIPDVYKDKDGYWSPIYVGALSFAVDKEWFEKNSLEYPASWDDLLKPEFKDQISIAHPGSSGTAYTVLATLVQMRGEEGTWDYLNKLNSNIRQYTKSGSAPPKVVALGEAAIGISFSHDSLKPTAEGYPVGLSFPKEGTGYEIGAIALVNGGPEKELENAKRFIDWSLTAEGQNLFEDSKSFRMPVNKNANPPEGAIKIDELTVIDYDFVWAGENRKRLVEEFTNRVANQDNLKQ